MGARYLNPEAKVDAAGRRLSVRFQMENASGRSWGPEAGLCVGWQLFDPATGLFIEEGPWKRLEREVAPGGHARQQVEIELPPESGRYHVYVSLLDEGSGWFYLRGWPLLLVEAQVERGQAKLTGVRTTTVRRLNWERRLRSLDKLVTGPAEAVWQNRGLIRSMVRRDLASRYRGSLGDVAWSVLNPVLLMATYYFVFGVVLRARFEGDPSRFGFALYFLAGMLPWLAFAEAVGRAPAVVLEYRNFVKKLVFPIEILPVNLGVAGLVTQALALGCFLVFLAAVRGGVPWTALWLPVLIAPQFLFTLGVAWFLAALGVYVRDLGQLMGYVLTLWFFLTPICYPEASLPGAVLPVLEKNPLFLLVRGFRRALLEAAAPDWRAVFGLWLIGAGACLLGYAWFRKLRRSFADVI
jgi:lipopolysaccharide transport system permease protein